MIVVFMCDRLGSCRRSVDSSSWRSPGCASSAKRYRTASTTPSPRPFAAAARSRTEGSWRNLFVSDCAKLFDDRALLRGEDRPVASSRPQPRARARDSSPRGAGSARAPPRVPPPTARSSRTSSRDQRLRRGQFALASLDIRAHHAAQVVEIVEEDVLELADGGIHVARQRDVENAERPVAAHSQIDALDVRHVDHGPRRCRGAQQHIHVGDARPRVLVVHRRRAVLRRQRLARARTCGSRRSPCARLPAAATASASSAISPAPSTIARRPASPPKIFFASCTAAELTLIAPCPMRVSLRTRPADRATRTGTGD